MNLSLRLLLLLLFLVSHTIPTTTSMATPAVARSIGKLHPSKTCLLLCDVQERFRSLIYNSETVINTCRFMTSVANVLDIPIVATQQHYKVFGYTCPDCFEHPDMHQATPMFEKKKFSMMTEEVQGHIDGLDKETFIVVGIETHICVQQTCLDLLEQGKDVHIIVDAVSSQRAIDREVALQRLAQSGAFLTTAQSAAFMLVGTAEHEQFKKISKLTVDHMQLKNGFDILAAGEKKPTISSD